MPQCESRKQDGGQCRANALRGQPFCFSHSPAAKQAKREAVAKGGRNRCTLRRAAPPREAARVRSIQDVQGLLYRTLEEVRNGVVDADLGRTIGYLAGVAAKVAEAAELDDRVRQVEERFRILHEQWEQQYGAAKPNRCT